MYTDCGLYDWIENLISKGENKIMREEITYIANDGTKFTSKEKCQEHDRKLEEKDAVDKEKNAALESIRSKYDSLIDDIEKYQAKYKEPITLTGNKPRYITMPEILREFFNMV